MFKLCFLFIAFLFPFSGHIERIEKETREIESILMPYYFQYQEHEHKLYRFSNDIAYLREAISTAPSENYRTQSAQRLAELEDSLSTLEPMFDLGKGIYRSKDSLFNSYYYKRADCIYTYAYAYKKEIRKIIYSFYDAMLTFYYQDDKLILFSDTEETSCNYYPVFKGIYFFKGDKLIHKVCIGKMTETRKLPAYSLRRETNVFTDEKSILKVSDSLYNAVYTRHLRK